VNSKIAIVARQELSLKFRSKVITISALLLIVLAGASPWISHLMSGKTESIRVAVLREANSEYKELKIATVKSRETDNVDVVYITGKSKSSAIKGLKNGDFSFVLGKNGRKLVLITSQSTSEVSTSYVIRTVNQLNVQNYLTSQGISLKAMDSYLLLNTPIISEVKEKKTKLDYSVALFALVLLYMILSLSGGLLALTIIEEKSGRIMEVLLSSISPKQLLLGKILGVLIFSVIQFFAIATTWIVSSNLANSSVVHGVTATQILFYLAWFVPAILSFSFIYGGLGALISRSEDAGAIQGPMSLLLIGSVYGAAYSLTNPNGQLVSIATYIPPFNFFIAPAQYLSTGEITISMVIGYFISLIFTGAVIKGALALFEGNVLKNRRFTLKGALH
jgi:ABC-2 type transport system permease protein